MTEEQIDGYLGCGYEVLSSNEGFTTMFSMEGGTLRLVQTSVLEEGELDFVYLVPKDVQALGHELNRGLLP